MSEEMKPCPFCKAKPISENRRRFFIKHKPECFLSHPLHNANFNIVSTGSVADHIEAWNARPAEDALKAEVERLKSVLEDVCSGCKRHTTFEDIFAIAISGEKSRACDDCYVKKALNKTMVM